MSAVAVAVVPYPALALQLLHLQLPRPLAELPSPAWLVDLLRPDAEAPLGIGDGVRAAVRDLLRQNGYRPTGRGKPSAEYLAAAAAAGRLASINAVVDAGNAVSLHTGLPISVVDLDRCRPPLQVGVPPPGSSYVFNHSGQTIDVAGLLSLADADGPCANAVKDAQRTKTTGATRSVLALVWGSALPAGHAAAAAHWLADVGTRLGAVVAPVVPTPA